MDNASKRPPRPLRPDITAEVILERVINGEPCKSVALDLGVDKRTIEFRLRGAKREYGARTLSHLVALYVRKKLGA